MALERRSFSWVELLDFMVTVNKGIEAPDGWIFLASDSQLVPGGGDRDLLLATRIAFIDFVILAPTDSS
jgi:hypothetical protein